MAAKTRFNDAEKAALRNNPLELKGVYFEIRNVMDFKTGISGEYPRIDESFFRERCGHTSSPGRKAYTPTISTIRHWIKCLERMGLVKHRGNYVFELLLADKDDGDVDEEELTGWMQKLIARGWIKNGDLTGKGKSEQNKCYRGATRGETRGATQKTYDKLLNDKGKYKQVRHEVEHEVLSRCDTPPEVYPELYIPLDNNINIQTSLPLDILGAKNSDAFFQKAPKEKKTIIAKEIEYDDKDFLAVWDSFPGRAGKKRKKAHAFKSWKTKGLGVFSQEMLADIAWSKQNDQQWVDGYPPDLVTYLNQRQWEADKCENPMYVLDDAETFMAKRAARKAAEKAAAEAKA